MIFTDAQRLLAQINADAPDWRLLAIDGWLGSGKTELAKQLSRLCELWALDLDCFMLLRIDAFMDALNWRGLAAAIEASDARLVISGVCVRDVLARLGLEADRHIYVKRMSGLFWEDEDDAIGDGLQEYAEAGFPPSGLQLEVHAYHLAIAPHLNRDYEYQRT